MSWDADTEGRVEIQVALARAEACRQAIHNLVKIIGLGEATAAKLDDAFVQALFDHNRGSPLREDPSVSLVSDPCSAEPFTPRFLRLLKENTQ